MKPPETAPEQSARRNNFVGVRLTTLIKAAGGMVAGSAVKITGSGNYSKTLSYSQVYSGTFNVYDQTGAAAVASNQPYMAIIYQLNGSALDSTTGPFETGVITASQPGRRCLPLDKKCL